MANVRSEEQTGSFIDVREAARLASRSPETIRRWVWSGRLGARRRGNRLWVRRDDVVALAHARRSEPIPSLPDWAASAVLALERSERGAWGSAADLVLEDRRARSDPVAPSGGR